MDAIGNFLLQLPFNVSTGIIATLFAYGVGMLSLLLLNRFEYEIYKSQHKLQEKIRSKKRKPARVTSAVLAHPLVFRPECTHADLNGTSLWNIGLAQVAAMSAGIFLFLLIDGDFFAASVQGGAIGYLISFGVIKFLTHLADERLRKNTFETLQMLREEILVQRNSTLRAMNSLRTKYHQHVEKYGSQSWYYKNYVLARLVYLVGNQPNFMPLQLLKQVGDEIGGSNPISAIVNAVSERIGQTGDASAALSEELDSYLQKYQDDMKVKIPQMSDKIFVPIMLTHFLPFLIILMWPIVDTIYKVMGVNMVGGQMPDIPLFNFR